VYIRYIGEKLKTIISNRLKQQLQKIMSSKYYFTVFLSFYKKLCLLFIEYTFCSDEFNLNIIISFDIHYSRQKLVLIWSKCYLKFRNIKINVVLKSYLNNTYN